MRTKIYVTLGELVVLGGGVTILTWGWPLWVHLLIPPAMFMLSLYTFWRILSKPLRPDEPFRQFLRVALTQLPRLVRAGRRSLQCDHKGASVSSWTHSDGTPMVTVFCSQCGWRDEGPVIQ